MRGIDRLVPLGCYSILVYPACVIDPPWRWARFALYPACAIDRVLEHSYFESLPACADRPCENQKTMERVYPACADDLEPNKDGRWYQFTPHARG